VRAFNGEFRITGRPGAGTTIEVFIPLAPDVAMPDDPDAAARLRATTASAAD
jgi:hypothetical protein